MEFFDATPSPSDFAWQPRSLDHMRSECDRLFAGIVVEPWPVSLPSDGKSGLLCELNPSSWNSIEEDLCARHRQLRCLVRVVGDHDVYFCSSKGIKRFNRLTRKVEVIIDVDFAIICFAVDKRFVAVGGSRRELLLFDHKEKHMVSSLKLSQGSMINSLSFQYFPSLDHPRLVAANNFPKVGVQVFDVPSMELSYSFPVPNLRERTSVGAAEVSPDGKKLAVVGDNSEVSLFAVKSHQMNPNIEFELIRRIPIPGPGHSISWAETSSYFAVACEAGIVILFDRNGDLVKVFHGKMSGADVRSLSIDHVAVRNVKISQNGIFLTLAFSHFQKYSVLARLNLETKSTVTQLVKRHLRQFSDIVGLDLFSDGSVVVGYQEGRHDPDIPQTPGVSSISSSGGYIAVLPIVPPLKLENLCLELIRKQIRENPEDPLVSRIKELPKDRQEWIVGNVDDYVFSSRNFPKLQL